MAAKLELPTSIHSLYLLLMTKRGPDTGVCIAAAVISIAAVAAGYSSYIRALARRGDFFALYEASRHAIETGSLSDPLSVGYYPPSGRPILMLLAIIPTPWIGAVCWWAISACLHGLCVYLLVRHLLPGECSRRARLAMVVLMAMLVWLVSDLAVGNVSSLLLASVVVSYFLYRKRYVLPSALVLSIGIVTKLLPIFLLVFYLVRRRWAVSMMTIVCTLAVGVLPGVLIFGRADFIASWKTWYDHAMSIRTARHTIMDSDRATFMNQAWPNILLRTLHPVSAGHEKKPFYVNVANLSRSLILKIWLSLAVTSGLLWVILIWPRASDPAGVEHVRFALVPLAMIWFSPHVMSYYMTLIMPALVILIWAIIERRETMSSIRYSLAGLGAIYILGCISTASDYARALGAYQMVVLALAVGIFLIIRQMNKHADPAVEGHRIGEGPVSELETQK
jgi:hypothetical protein